MKAMITNVFRNINFDLCCHLLDEGNEVIGIDEISSNEQKEERLLQIGRNANFHFLDKDSDNIARSDIDVIFQIAQDNDKTYYSARKKSANMERIITIAKQSNAKIVYLSSLDVYGNLYGEIDEKTSVRPTTPFGLRVYYEEKTLKDNDVPYVILRSPTVYGTWFTKDMVKGLDTRSNAIFVKDIIQALLLAADSQHKHEVFNISPTDQKEETYRFAAQKTKNILGFKQTVSLAKGKRILYNAINSTNKKTNGNN